MSHGRLMHWIVCRILLVALAIQGISADAEDIASINALRVLCLMPGEFDGSGGGDEWPDDVCEAATAEMSFVVMRKAENDFAFVSWMDSRDNLTGEFEQAAACVGLHSGPFPTGALVIRSPGRLLC